jgi:hypothetical protein
VTDIHDVIVVGAGFGGLCAGIKLREAGVTNFVILEKADDVGGTWRQNAHGLDAHLRSGREIVSSVFDDTTDTWMLNTRGGENYRARVVIGAFHSTEWDHDFEPAGKRAAVSGTRPGRWLFHNVPGARIAYRFGIYWSARTHLRRRVPDPTPPGNLARPNVELIGQNVVGSRGLTIQLAWRDGMEAYLGVALHGFPNYFLITGPIAGWGNQSIAFVMEAQVHYILECLKLMERTGSTRIEVRRSTQRLFNERIHAKIADSASPGSSVSYWRRMRDPVPSAFDLSGHTAVEEEVYDGPATIRIGDDDHAVRVRLTGHLEPIDGRYHWQGTVFEAAPNDELKATQSVSVTIGDRTAQGRITERTPWGSYSVAGFGAPPFDLDEVELTVPQR